MRTWNTNRPDDAHTNVKAEPETKVTQRWYRAEARGSLCYGDPDFMRSLGADAMKSKG